MSAALHGTGGLLAAYAAAQAPLLAALWQARAPVRRLLLAPLAALPVMALAGAMLAGGGALAQAYGLGAGLGELFGVGFTASLGYATGRLLARSAGQSIHQRGALLAPAPRAAAAAAGTLTLGGIALQEADETKHFKLIGTTGTGKSTAIQELLRGALARGDRVVVADPDGSYLRRFFDARRGDAVLNPFEPGSARWDLFGEIDHDYDVEQLARSLIPDHEGADRSWRGYARTFFSSVASQAHAAGSRDVRDLYRLLVIAGTAELRTLVAGTPAQPFLEEHNGRMFDSIRSVTSSAVGALEYVARQQAAPLAVRAWVREPAAGRALFLPYRAGQIAALRATISAWMRLAIFEALQSEERRQRLWFVVDELDALGQIDGLKDALARLRKFNGRCVLGFQSVAQVSSTYGSGEANTIVENCGNTLILRCSGSEHGGTSLFASRLVGEREVLRTTRSRSHQPGRLLAAVTHGEQRSTEPALMAAEIEQLPDLRGYLKLASQPHWQAVRLTPQPSPRRERSAAQRAAAAEQVRTPEAERGAEYG